MKITDAFPSKYLKSEDLSQREVEFTISSVTFELVGDAHKPVASFAETKKLWVINKTNAATLADSYGAEMDEWVGHKVVLLAAKTPFQGKSVPCIRAKVPALQAANN